MVSYEEALHKTTNALDVISEYLYQAVSVYTQRMSKS
jgi:hypothetical protein